MDFRAAKIILATFLFIAFATPFFRLSVAMPKKGKEHTTLALAESMAASDSASFRTSPPRGE